MYVVKRPFKCFGKTYTAGSVITEPATIKRFKGKLAEGKIIEVTEQTYESIALYFKKKYGVILPTLTGEVTEEVAEEVTEEVAEEVTEEVAEEVTEEVKEKPKAKKAVKASAVAK